MNGDTSRPSALDELVNDFCSKHPQLAAHTDKLLGGLIKFAYLPFSPAKPTLDHIAFYQTIKPLDDTVTLCEASDLMAKAREAVGNKPVVTNSWAAREQKDTIPLSYESQRKIDTIRDECKAEYLKHHCDNSNAEGHFSSMWKFGFTSLPEGVIAAPQHNNTITYYHYGVLRNFLMSGCKFSEEKSVQIINSVVEILDIQHQENLGIRTR
jgi:hypothetical protein